MALEMMLKGKGMIPILFSLFGQTTMTMARAPLQPLTLEVRQVQPETFLYLAFMLRKCLRILDISFVCAERHCLRELPKFGRNKVVANAQFCDVAGL